MEESRTMSASELDQLRAEVAELRRGAAMPGRVEVWMRTLAPLGAAIAFCVGVIQYVINNNNEFRKAFWKEQYALYQEVCEDAAAISVAGQLDRAGESREGFWKLYYGRLSILEHPEVKKAMMEYGSQLRKVEKGEASTDSLQPWSYRLARACRESLRKTWNPADLGDVDAKK
jgi:hypothetical protein